MDSSSKPPKRPLAWKKENDLYALVERLLQYQYPYVDDYKNLEDAWLHDRTIPELRVLIEAFLNAARDDPTLKDRVVGKDADEEKRKNTKYLSLRIRDCTVQSCSCTDLDIACTLATETCHFGDRARFIRATFGGVASFGGVTFGGVALFSGATFGGEALFDGAMFGDWAWFEQATFGGEARFDEATFGGEAQFDEATFGGPASFNWATFGDWAWFDGATFGGRATFNMATFHGLIVGDARLFDLRGALFGEELPSSKQARAGFGWPSVRGFGKLDLLSRVSYIALLLVPVLAALWPAIRSTVDSFNAPPVDPINLLLTDVPTGELVRQELYIPLSLALAFFAAVAVTIGQTIYQVWAPEAIRKHDIEGFVDSKTTRYEGLRSSDGSADAANDALRDATEKLAAIARERPGRNANLVRRYSETIWIPPTDHLDWFEDPKRDTTEDVAKSENSSKIRSPHVGDPGIISGAERARIAIEEGARAEYWLLGRERLRRAAGAAAAYQAGIFFILAIFVIQIWKVIDAASDWAWGLLGLSLLVVIWLMLKRIDAWEGLIKMRDAAALRSPAVRWLQFAPVMRRVRNSARGGGPWIIATRGAGRNSQHSSND